NMIYSICRFWSESAFFLWGIRHYNIYESPLKGDHPVVYVFNHVSYIDIPMWLKATSGRHIRVLGKAEMAKIPIFGYIYKEAAILVDRSNAEARAKSLQELKYFLGKNISVVIAPEGTFNMTNQPLAPFFDGAFRIAIETRTPIRPVVFPDVEKRLSRHTVFTLSPGGSRAIFLPEISVEDYSISDIQLLKQKTYNVMEDALLRYKASWIKSKA
ncbi:MAG: 1-acyl-sn-glycerol-3-phosphate acyltransferase, partial [Chitinophagaceae bacterium]